ncbi:MAG: hypothetical protein EOP88_16095 [Verrucomicrobiaceae bacterium]|nr:MAG: hypothetical protein EOP88_16095 [Verrucomicrobiaceae bacterium]
MFNIDKFIKTFDLPDLEGEGALNMKEFEFLVEQIHNYPDEQIPWVIGLLCANILKWRDQQVDCGVSLDYFLAFLGPPAETKNNRKRRLNHITPEQVQLLLEWLKQAHTWPAFKGMEEDLRDAEQFFTELKE